MKQRITQSIDDHVALVAEVRSRLVDDIQRAATMLIEALEHGNKVLLCGNGGSAADSQHIAAELTGRFLQKDRRPLPAIALTTDTSALTALGNDFGFDQIFARQVQALGRAGDVLIGVSTSGNSKNIIEACTTAHRLGIATLAITGADGGKLKAIADLVLVVPSSATPRIQEIHIMIGHILCEEIDQYFTPKSS